MNCKHLCKNPVVYLDGKARVEINKRKYKKKRYQLDVTCFIISLFNAQHVSDVNTSILRSLRLI